MSVAIASSLHPVYMHVHVIGNGKSGSGCLITPRWWQRLFINMMGANIGLKTSPNDPALDQLYVERLLRWVNGSTLKKVVILACDDLYDETGHRFPGLTGLFVPNDYVLELSRQYSEFLPAASIHPARRDALAEVERCVDAGAVVLKLLPCVQAVDCNRHAYKPFWERMALLKLPLLAHTGG